MPHMEVVCVAGKVIEVIKYYTYRVHAKGEKRAKKSSQTPEAQKKVNLRKAERNCRWLMNGNFQDGDYLVRMDFYKDVYAGSSDRMQDLMEKFLKKLRTGFRREGKILKYIYVKEIGPRGGKHIHMMINKCDIELLRKCWTYGGIHVDPLNSNGQYRKIAAYFMKYAAKTEETEGQLVGKRYYPSRNLQKPKITKRIIKNRQIKKEVKVQQGYILDNDTVQSGISEYTGFEYFCYTLIKEDTEGSG